MPGGGLVDRRRREERARDRELPAVRAEGDREHAEAVGEEASRAAVRALEDEPAVLRGDGEDVCGRRPHAAAGRAVHRAAAGGDEPAVVGDVAAVVAELHGRGDVRRDERSHAAAVQVEQLERAALDERDRAEVAGRTRAAGGGVAGSRERAESGDRGCGSDDDGRAQTWRRKRGPSHLDDQANCPLQAICAK